MSVVSVKVSPETKKEMKKLSDVIEWPSEIRGFIENRLAQAKRIEALERAKKALKKMPETPKGTAAKLVREDRDRGH